MESITTTSFWLGQEGTEGEVAFEWNHPPQESAGAQSVMESTQKADEISTSKG